MVGKPSPAQAMNRSQLVSFLSDRISRIVRRHPVRIAVDGFDAAGKTTLASELGCHLEERGRHIIRASADGFHNPRSVRYRRGPNSPEGYLHDSFDYRALTTTLLQPLGPGGDRRYLTAVFDYRIDEALHSRSHVAPDDAILVFDGIFLQRPDLSDCWEYKIFLDVTIETVLNRAITRQIDMDFSDGQNPINGDLKQRYLVRYIPAQREYLRRCRPMDSADIVIDNNDPSEPIVSRSKQ